MQYQYEIHIILMNIVDYEILKIKKMLFLEYSIKLKILYVMSVKTNFNNERKIIDYNAYTKAAKLNKI